MESYVLSITKQALYLILILSAAPVLVALMVGLTVSIVQATTQVQEQTLTFVPKLVAMVLTLAFAGPWMMNYIVTFIRGILEQFPDIVRG